MNVTEMQCGTLHAERPAHGEVHLWHFQCNDGFDESLLSADERARAARFTIEAPRREFVAGRCTLRTVLGSYLNVNPAAIAFTVHAGGKPAIRGVEHLHFNVTHSGGRGIIAVASQPVGIDIEQIRPMPNAEGLVNRFFTMEEREQFAHLDDNDKLHGFFRGWTGKEALLKAVGVGLAGVEQVAVDLDPVRPARIVRFDNQHNNWELKTWSIDADFIVSVAIQKE